MDPLAIELVAIQNMGKWKNKRGEKCGSGLAHHVMEAVKLMWPETYFHKWNEKMLFPELCKPGRLAIFGPSSCVTGSTKIEDPITGDSVPIRFLCENRVAPVVMTVNGPRKACVPFLKGTAPIYEVELESGSVFRCTAQHRVMLSSGRYASVSSLHPGAHLQGYARHPLSTISGTGLSGHVSSAPRCSKIIPDFQAGYRSGFRSCDVRLPLEEDTAQLLSPSQAYARKHTESACVDVGGLDCEGEHIPGGQLFSLPSNCNASPSLSISKIFESLHSVQETHGFESFQSQLHSLCRSKKYLGLGPFSGSYRDDYRTHYPDADPILDCSFSGGIDFTARVDKVSSISRSKTEEFYDIHVPVENHYFAEGCVHHNSGKSVVFSQFALTMFYARPKGTTVIISSTTLDALKARIWGYVTSYDKQAKKKYPWLPGHMIESSQKLLADPSTEDGRSFTDGIMGVALKRGGTWQNMADLVGRKNEVMIIGCDELSYCPVSILDSLANLESNECCFAAFMGNLPDVHNSLAKAAEPKGGWESLPDTERSRIYETKWFNGRAIQLIGTDSPNLDFPEGQEPYKNLIGRRYIEQCAHNYGRESDKFNMFASGKIPRSSMNRTVFTKSQCIKFHAMDSVTWGHHELVRGYGIDAAYSGVGGDRTIGFPFAFGRDNTNQWRLWFGRMVTFMGSDSPKMTHAEAIVHQCKQECDAAGIPPEHVFYDGTGRSELTIAFARLWSAKVVPLEFGGPATDRPSFTGEKHFHGEQLGEVKTCREAFDRFVSELWFASSYCITSDQMRGITEEAIEEGSQRKWELVRGAKQCIETKDDMKERGLRSPDIWDSVVVCCEGARRLGFPLGKTTTPNKASTNRWLEGMREEQWKRLQKEQLAA